MHYLLRTYRQSLRLASKASDQLLDALAALCFLALVGLAITITWCRRTFGGSALD